MLSISSALFVPLLIDLLHDCQFDVELLQRIDDCVIIPFESINLDTGRHAERFSAELIISNVVSLKIVDNSRLGIYSINTICIDEAVKAISIVSNQDLQLSIEYSELLMSLDAPA